MITRHVYARQDPGLTSGPYSVNGTNFPGQMHMQDGPKGLKHWLIDPDTRQFVDPKAPRYMKELLTDPAVQNAITKGRSYLGLP